MTNDEQLHEQHTHLTEYVNGLYEEASKLSNKHPNASVTSLMVKKVNRAITDTKRLLEGEGDPYIDDIELLDDANEFDFTGPENRDVVIILRQLKDSLELMRRRHAVIWNTYR